jgi:cyclopropane fatty-acyl-phospholipid synthase-like methyltransferase
VKNRPNRFQYSIPKAEKESPLSIINQTIESLGLKAGDTILDLQAGWGRTILGAAILHPELNFLGI